MLTTDCTLRLGGRTAHAQVVTDSPQATATVTYSGDIELFGKRYPEMANSDLRMISENRAEQSGAELSVKETGEYDWFAE